MAAANPQQIQNYSDRARKLAEMARDFRDACQEYRAGFDSVYEALNVQNPNNVWTDTRNDAPPNLLLATDKASYRDRQVVPRRIISRLPVVWHQTRDRLSGR